MNNKKSILIFIFLLVVFIMPSFKVEAAKVYLTSDGVNVRSGAGTTYNSLGTSATGDSYDFMTTVPTTDSSSGCGSGNWYQISYNSSLAYICTTFATTVAPVIITTTTEDEYYRPWVTPKKSIEGGARYISKYYISKGQDSIYLKKFNVGPNSVYTKYGHQYQTNLTAAVTEAEDSYTIYSENNLLVQPLIFEIPVYNNMPIEATPYPGGSSDMSGSEILDSAFEVKLDEQGFNPSYKRKLRALHILHPNWTFKALNTGLDWNSSIVNEQPNSYVYSCYDSSLELLEQTTGALPVLGGDGLYHEYTSSGMICKEDNGSNYCLKEGSMWYLANSAATAYYLDPRNFLTEKRILMFEKLSYSPLYTESVIQSYLNGTFMSGKSSLDNQNYASIFVEAGQKANVSPIYLASLVTQEVGMNGSISTSGGQFTYGGQTYAGLYNFYNIGASSSSVNPVIAGLIWANNGSTATIVNGTTPSTETTLLAKFGLTKTNGYITGVTVGQSVSQLKATNTTSLVVKDINNNVVGDNSLIATGSKIVITNTDGTSYTSLAVIYGDISGDGEINAFDLLYIRKNLLGTYTLTGANELAAHVTKNSSIGPVDLLYLRKFLLDPYSYKINQ